MLAALGSFVCTYINSYLFPRKTGSKFDACEIAPWTPKAKKGFPILSAKLGVTVLTLGAYLVRQELYGIQLFHPRTCKLLLSAWHRNRHPACYASDHSRNPTFRLGVNRNYPPSASRSFQTQVVRVEISSIRKRNHQRPPSGTGQRLFKMDTGDLFWLNKLVKGFVPTLDKDMDHWAPIVGSLFIFDYFRSLSLLRNLLRKQSFPLDLPRAIKCRVEY